MHAHSTIIEGNLGLQIPIYWKGFLLELVPVAMGALHTLTQIVSTACNPSTPTSGTFKVHAACPTECVVIIAEVCSNLYIEVCLNKTLSTFQYNEVKSCVDSSQFGLTILKQQHKESR